MKTIAVYNNKGGVAKTTSVINIAGSLCVFQKAKVLIVDLDSQGCASKFLLAENDYPWQLQCLPHLFKGEAKNIEDIIQCTSYRYYDRAHKTHPEMFLDILPTTEELVQTELTDIHVLTEALALVEKDYDYCLLDMPPANADITYIGLCAADYLLSPCMADNFSVDAIANVEQIFVNAKQFNPHLQFAGAFIANTDTRYGVEKWIKTNFEDNQLFFKSYVKHASCFADALLSCKPVICITGASGIEDYRNVTKELLKRIKEMGV